MEYGSAREGKELMHTAAGMSPADVMVGKKLDTGEQRYMAHLDEVPPPAEGISGCR